MNTFIKPSRLLAACAALTLSSVLLAESSTAPSQPSSPGYHEPGPGVTTKKDMVSHSDRVFLEKAAKAGMKEVAVSQAVLANLTTPEARQFAERMIKDHTAGNEQLKALAAKKAVTLPAEDKAEKLGEKWSEKNKDLDEKYLKQMTSDHKEVVELYQKGAKSEDPDIAAFASKMLPTLEEHLEMAHHKKAAH